MYDNYDVDDMIADTTQQGKFIKLPNTGDKYTGVFLGFHQTPKELQGNNGTYKIYTAYFENIETGEEQELGFTNAMLKAFKEAGSPKPDTIITVERTEVEMTDRETGEPVLDDNGDVRVMTGWVVSSKKSASGAKKAASGEVAEDAGEEVEDY